MHVTSIIIKSATLVLSVKLKMLYALYQQMEKLFGVKSVMKKLSKVAVIVQQYFVLV